MGNTQTGARPYQLLWISISDKAGEKNDLNGLMLRSSFPPSVLVICKCSKCYFLLFIIMVISGSLSISGFINQPGLWSVSDICVFNIFVRSRGRVKSSPSQSKATLRPSPMPWYAALASNFGWESMLIGHWGLEGMTWTLDLCTLTLKPREFW